MELGGERGSAGLVYEFYRDIARGFGKGSRRFQWKARLGYVEKKGRR